MHRFGKLSVDNYVLNCKVQRYIVRTMDLDGMVDGGPSYDMTSTPHCSLQKVMSVRTALLIFSRAFNSSSTCMPAPACQRVSAKPEETRTSDCFSDDAIGQVDEAHLGLAHAVAAATERMLRVRT